MNTTHKRIMTKCIAALRSIETEDSTHWREAVMPRESNRVQKFMKEMLTKKKRGEAFRKVGNNAYDREEVRIK